MSIETFFGIMGVLLIILTALLIVGFAGMMMPEAVRHITEAIDMWRAWKERK